MDFLEDPLSLDELPPPSKFTKRNHGPQAIEIVFTGDTSIKTILEGIQNAETAHVSLGKKPAILVNNGKTIHPILPISQEWGLLYKQDSGSSELKLAAPISLKDAAARAKLPKSQELDFNDPALMALQQNLAEEAQKREANTVEYVKDTSLLPPAKSGRAALKAMKDAKKLSRFSNHRQLLSDRTATPRSIPASPSLGAVTPNSAAKVDRRTMKQDALKRALIHLLAVRGHSKQEILDNLKCTANELQPLLDKYQGRMDGTKYNLSDKGYRELDIWKFPYRSDDDRMSARERAISAYDRQRISVKDDLWQLLLSKEEKIKGTRLSKLNLHMGPVKPVKTPQIHVESTNGNGSGSGSGSGNGNDSSASAAIEDADRKKNRLEPGTTKTGKRSSSQEPGKKSKTSEKEAQAKRLFAKDPKKAAAQATKPKETKPSQPAVTKKVAPKKATTVPNSKIKSDEFIEDSDEDIDMVEVLSPDPPTERPSPKPTTSTTAPSAPTPAVPTTSAKPVKPLPKPTTKPAVKVPIKITKEPKKQPMKPVAPSRPTVSPPKTSSNVGSKDTASANKAKDVVQNPAPLPKPVTHRRSNSSPKKPSPLGSSPPTNASDMDIDQPMRSSKSSSSSNSPLINHRRDHETVARKAPPRPSAPTAGNSDARLKRKANDIESGIHDHGGDVDMSRLDRPVKRRMSSSENSLRSDTPSDGPSILSRSNIEDSQKFIRQLKMYQRKLRELKTQKNPPREMVERLHRLHKQLDDNKRRLWRIAGY